jgi:hypothetical protein
MTGVGGGGKADWEHVMHALTAAVRCKADRSSDWSALTPDVYTVLEGDVMLPRAAPTSLKSRPNVLTRHTLAN